MNPVALFLSPVGRLNAAGFWIGLAALAAIAIALYVASTHFGLSPLAVMIGWVVLLYPFICIWAKRFHDKGSTGWFVLLPLLIGLTFAGIVGAVVAGTGSFDLMRIYAEREKGMDNPDLAALGTLAQDPAFQADFQAWAEKIGAADDNDPELGPVKAQVDAAAQSMARNAGFGFFAAFWGVVILFALWAGTGRDPNANAHGDPA